MDDAKATDLVNKFKVGLEDHHVAKYLYEKDKLRQLYQAKINEQNSAYKSSHWDEPNIIAHVRMNDRNIDGKLCILKAGKLKTLEMIKLDVDSKFTLRKRCRNYGCKRC